MKLRAIVLVPALALTAACSGPPARIVVGAADTVVLNNVYAVRLPVRLLDVRGHELHPDNVRFRFLSGDTLPLTDDGVVTCARSGDAVARATRGRLATDFLIRCRPVDTLYVGGIEMVAGDSAQPIPIGALGPDKRPVTLLAAVTRMYDTTVASIEGSRIRPRSPGETRLDVRVGDRAQGVWVRVYERTSSVAGIRPAQNRVVPVSLTSGEARRWTLPPGSYIVGLRPDDSPLHVALLNAGCMRLTWSRDFFCQASAGGTVIVYSPWRRGDSPPVSGQLAVRRLATEVR